MALIRSEQPYYQAQRHNCYGVQPCIWGIDTIFRPWVIAGGTCHWLEPQDTRSAALEVAREFALSLDA